MFRHPQWTPEIYKCFQRPAGERTFMGGGATARLLTSPPPRHSCPASPFTMRGTCSKRNTASHCTPPVGCSPCRLCSGIAPPALCPPFHPPAAARHRCRGSEHSLTTQPRGQPGRPRTRSFRNRLLCFASPHAGGACSSPRACGQVSPTALGSQLASALIFEAFPPPPGATH